jgi:hypothetical protein
VYLERDEGKGDEDRERSREERAVTPADELCYLHYGKINGKKRGINGMGYNSDRVCGLRPKNEPKRDKKNDWLDRAPGAHAAIQNRRAVATSYDGERDGTCDAKVKIGTVKRGRAHERE